MHEDDDPAAARPSSEEWLLCRRVDSLLIAAPRQPTHPPIGPRRYETGRSPSDLALRELWRLARLVQSGLLALDLARVARQEALALERHAELRVRLDECAGDAVANGAGLAGQP